MQMTYQFSSYETLNYVDLIRIENLLLMGYFAGSQLSVLKN